MQTDLADFLSELKGLGYLVKLDTNGSLPSRLDKVIEAGFVDYIAMDIKTSLEKYEIVANVKINKATIYDSIRLIMNSGIDYEFRTTLVKNLVKKDDFFKNHPQSPLPPEKREAFDGLKYYDPNEKLNLMLEAGAVSREDDEWVESSPQPPKTWNELLETTGKTLDDLGGLAKAQAMTEEQIQEKWEEWAGD